MLEQKLYFKLMHYPKSGNSQNSGLDLINLIQAVIFIIETMEVVKQNVTVPANRELLIKLPKNAAPN